MGVRNGSRRRDGAGDRCVGMVLEPAPGIGRLRMLALRFPSLPGKGTGGQRGVGEGWPPTFGFIRWGYFIAK